MFAKLFSTHTLSWSVWDVRHSKVRDQWKKTGPEQETSGGRDQLLKTGPEQDTSWGRQDQSRRPVLEDDWFRDHLAKTHVERHHDNEADETPVGREASVAAATRQCR